MQDMNKTITMQGAPHRPLQVLRGVNGGVKGVVASTGNSPLASILEGLAVGGRRYDSPREAHWNSLLKRYSSELRHLHWENTGEVTPRRERRKATHQVVPVRVNPRVLADLLKMLE